MTELSSRHPEKGRNIMWNIIISGACVFAYLLPSAPTTTGRLIDITLLACAAFLAVTGLIELIEK